MEAGSFVYLQNKPLQRSQKAREKIHSDHKDTGEKIQNGEIFVHHISPSSMEGCSYKLGQASEESSHFGHERVRVDLSRGRFLNNCYVLCL